MNQLQHVSASHGIATCPSCGNTACSAHYRYTHDNGESFICRCSRCSLEFMRPLVLTDVHDRMMESVDDAEMFNSNVLRTLHKRLIIAPEIAKVRKLLGKNDFSMLDVGCGTGWISRIWGDSGAQVTGLEPSQPRAKIAQQRGVRVLSCYAEDLDSDEHFDLIVVRHVLEHLEDPVKVLRDFASRLTTNGLLLIIVPNIDCIGRKLFNTNWTWVLPWHCNFFNQYSLSSLLDLSGYDIVQMYQTPSPLWYPESFARCFPRLGRLLHRTKLSMLLFAPLIVLGQMTAQSDNITVLARPKLG